ncbi:MAG: FKBP-type peptidyl-prolyl cis-trans isomerase [Candidatus Pacebacteria bacterium]|nr:FKBP-type peptidyl-prolyl cis-trans isomerase [Candidatus Paceibacterota bacterium]
MKTLISTIVSLSVVCLFFYLGYHYFNNINLEEENKPINEAVNIQNQELKIEVLKEGEGDGAENGDLLTVDYTGTLENGAKFDSSIDRKTPFVFTLGKGEVIKGWEQGLLGAKAGEKLKLIIPPNLAYGENGVSGLIPPNAVLIFEVDVLDIDNE